MKRNKTNKIFAMLLFIFIILLGNSVYAAICDLSIVDSTEETGFIEKDGKLYYVVSVNTENAGGNLSGVTLKFKYDMEHLVPLSLDEGETLDLGTKGVFTGAGRLEYAGWNNDEEQRFNQDNMILSVYKNESGKLTQIEDKKITLITLCFEVLDNVKERRAVYIDTFDSKNEILYASFKSDQRYITNGVDNSVIEELEKKDVETQKIVIEYEDGTKVEQEVVVDKKDPVNSGSSIIDKTDKTSKEPGKMPNGDTTIADKIIPNAGVRTLLLIIFVVSIISFVVYKRMKKYEKIVK